MMSKQRARRVWLGAPAAAWVALAGAGIGVGVALPRSAVAAEEKKKEKEQSVSPEIGKKLKAAKEAIDKSDFDAGIALAREAVAASSKPYDLETSLRYLQFGASKKLDWDAYAEAAEQLLKFDTLTPDERLKSYKALAQIYGQQKNYGRAAEYATKWGESGGGFDAYSLLSQLYLIQKDCKNGIAALEKSVEAAARPPNEEEMRRQNSCYYQLGDKPRRQAANEGLVLRFLKKDYYTDLVNLYHEQNMDPRALLHLYRFGYDRSFLTRETEFIDYVAEALDVGAPVEAEAVIAKGTELGAMKFIAASDRNSRMREQAKLQAAEDRKGLAQFDKDARAGKSGEVDVKLGLVYLGFGDNKKAVEAIQRGLEPERVGKVKRIDDANMTLGIAYARLGDKEGATKAFTAAKADPRMEKAAAVWLSAL